MNVDALPIPVLIVCALGAWLVYGLVLSTELEWNRRHDLDARVTRADVSAQRGQHGVVDDAEHGEQPEPGQEQEPQEREERVGSHGGIVPDRPVILPPGIPSVTERLDRWKELS